MEEEEPFKNKGGQLQRSESEDKPTEIVMDDAHQQEVKEDMTGSAIDKKKADPESKKPEEEEDPESKPEDYTISFYSSGPLPVSIAQKLNESNKGVLPKTTSVDSSESGESGRPQTSSDSSMRESWTKQKSTESEPRTIPSGNSFDTEENFSESEERSPKGTHSLSENGKKTGNSEDSGLGRSPTPNLSESMSESSDDDVECSEDYEPEVTTYEPLMTKTETACVYLAVILLDFLILLGLSLLFV